MEQRPLGNSGLSVSVLGLGTMTFGAESDEGASHAILDGYTEAGGRFIDTANVYSHGVSEEIIGRWLASYSTRDQLVIATKARFSMSDDPLDVGAGRRQLRRALEASLRRLGIDEIDLYQVHAWDPETPVEETMGALDDFVREGMVRAIGVSNYLGWQLERAYTTAERNGWAQLVSLQPQYNLLAREIELDSVPVCLDRSLALLPWSPLGGGWLTGKYSSDQRPAGATRLGEDPDRGVEAYDLRNNEQTWRILGVVEDIASGRGVTMSQVALNWVRDRPGVASALIGCRTTEQLEDNLGSLDWRLDAEETAALTEVSAPGIPSYPHRFLARQAGMRVWDELGTTSEPPS